MRKKLITITILILIILLGSFLRIYKINSIPPGLYPDEAINGNNAYEALENKDFKVFYSENNGREGLFINLVAYSIKFLGLKIESIRIISALIGILTIFTLYLLAKEIFYSESIALLSSFFLAISFWHLNFSRIGFRGILVPLISTLSFYFLFKYLKERKISDFLYSSFFFSLGFYTYIPYRVIFLLLLLVIIFDFFESKKEIKKFFLRWSLFILLVFIFSLPLILYFYHHPLDFISRASGVSIFTTGEPVSSFLKSLVATLLMFNFKGDCNWRHNFACQPQLWYFQGLLFLIGLILFVYGTFNWSKNSELKRDKTFLFLLSYLFIFLLPAVLTSEGIPHALRSIGAIPPVYLIIGFTTDYLFKFSRQFFSKKILCPVVLVLLFFLIGVTYYRYFSLWAKKKETKDAFSYNLVKLSEKINSEPRTKEKYIVCYSGGVLVKERGEPRYLPMPTQTVMFLTDSFLFQKRIYHHIHYLLLEEENKIPKEKSVSLFEIK